MDETISNKRRKFKMILKLSLANKIEGKHILSP